MHTARPPGGVTMYASNQNNESFPVQPTMPTQPDPTGRPLPPPQYPPQAQAAYPFSPASTMNETVTGAPSPPPSYWANAGKPVTSQHEAHNYTPLSPTDGESGPTKKTSMESWIGKNVIGVIAAILVFLGLLFLGLLVIPSLDDFIKIALMFLLSAALTASGSALTRRKKNSFTVALLGCGCGSFFISILLSHVYFQAIPDLAAFGLLLAWLIGSLLLVKMSDSIVMSLLVQAGAAVSLCFAYATRLEQGMIILILIYHALSVTLIVVGTKLCCKKTDTVGLFVSLLLSLIAATTMLSYYAEALTYPTGPTQAVSLAVFAFHTIGASVLSYLFLKAAKHVRSKAARILLYGINKAILLAIAFVATFLFPYVFAYNVISTSAVTFGFSYHALIVAAGVTSLYAIGHVFISLFIGRKDRVAAELEPISTIVFVTYAALISFNVFILCGLIWPHEFRLPGFLVSAFVLLACARITRKSFYTSIALGALALDVSTMVFMGGYASLVTAATLAGGFAYMLLHMAVLTYVWLRLDEERRQQKILTFELALILLYEVTVISLFSSARMEGIYGFVALTAALLLVFVLKLDIRTPRKKSFWLFLRWHELVLVIIAAFYLALYGSTISTTMLPWLLAGLALLLLICSLYRIATSPYAGMAWFGTLIGVCATLLVLCSLYGLTPWLDIPFVSSIVLLVIAMTCVLLGFLMRVKPIRLYGLIVVIICILKLVTLDVGNAETIMRAVAFISGGLICFGISALYNYAVKRFGKASEA